MEERFRIRLANSVDVQQLANVHWITSSIQPGGFMYRLGKGFLVQYYKALFEEKNSVILCAELGDTIVGVVSGSLNSEEHKANLKKKRLQLFLGALPALTSHPDLIKGMLSRQESISSSASEVNYIVLSGVRLEYWGWLPGYKNVLGAVSLLQDWLKLMQIFGSDRIIFEVDEVNLKSYEIHCALGARVVKKYMTGDGKNRILMEYVLNEES